MLHSISAIVKETLRKSSEHNISRFAASLAYYALFSTATLLIVAVAIAAHIFGYGAARDQAIAALTDTVGPNIAGTIQVMMETANRPANNLLASIIGVFSLLLGASSLFGELQSALNTIWGSSRPGSGVIGLAKQKIVSFLIVISTGFILILMLITSSLVSGLHDALDKFLPGLPIIAQSMDILISLAILTFLFALTFKVIPNARIAWRPVILGAAVTALFFSLGKQALALYLGRHAVKSIDGAAGFLPAFLIWVYYSGEIVLLGAEFTKAYADKRELAKAPNSNLKK